MNTSASNQITVILPCAGEGTRLGLDYPKELYEIWPEFPLIRFCLEHVVHAVSTTDLSIRIVLVIRTGKEALVEWVKAFFGDQVEVVIIHLVSLAGEWPTSIFSAQSYFSERNLVLLPDTCSFVTDQNWLLTANGDGLIESMMNQLCSSTFCLASVPCEDSARLERLGAIRVENESVVEFQDKPKNATAGVFNAFWSAMAFKREVGEELFELLQHSVCHEEHDFSDCSFFPPSNFSIVEHVDFGTWEIIRKYQGLYGSFQEFQSDVS